MDNKRYIVVRKQTGTTYEVLGIMSQDGLFGSYKLLLFNNKGDIQHNEYVRGYIPNGYFQTKDHSFTEIE